MTTAPHRHYDALVNVHIKTDLKNKNAMVWDSDSGSWTNGTYTVHHDETMVGDGTEENPLGTDLQVFYPVDGVGTMADPITIDYNEHTSYWPQTQSVANDTEVNVVASPASYGTVYPYHVVHLASNGQYTIPLPGLYRINVMAEWGSSAAGLRQLSLYQNGNLQFRSSAVDVRDTTAVWTFPVKPEKVGETFQVKARQASGGTRTCVFVVSIEYLGRLTVEQLPDGGS